MLLIDFFDRLFPPPPLAPYPDHSQKRWAVNRARSTAFVIGCGNVAEGRYSLKEDLDKLRSSLRDFKF